MGDDEQKKYRHELKYLLSDGQLAILHGRMDARLPKDSHAGKNGMYRIRSLYFDDYDDRCLRENEDGTDPREKFRIRIYNGSRERISLECKRKERGKTLKTACALTEEQTRTLMKGKLLPDFASQPPLLRKLSIAMQTQMLRPVVIVEYDRLPYIYKNGNVRITLDTNIASSGAVDRFLDPWIPRRPVLPVGQQLLEVKYDAYLPDFIYQGLELQELRQTAFSKYYICRKYTR